MFQRNSAPAISQSRKWQKKKPSSVQNLKESRDLTQKAKKIVDVYNLNMRIWSLFKDIVVMVLGYDIFGICLKSTIYKFVIIRVGCNQMQMEIDLHLLRVGEIEQCLNDVRCYLWSHLLGKNLFVFRKNFVGETKSVFPFNKISPNGIVLAATRE